MAASHSSPQTEGAKMEQIITEFFAKSLHIILESRSPYMSSRNFSGEQIICSPSSSSSPSSSIRNRDKWFNLALRECPAALENLDLWRQSNPEPMVVDVILVQRPVDWPPLTYSPKGEVVRNFSWKERYPFCWNSDQEELGCEAKNEKIIERWTVQYESKRSRDFGSGSRRSSNTLHVVYKKSILLLRSLYATIRLLPAYKIFRDLNSSGQIHTFSLTHRVSSFAEPFTRKEDAEMQQFGFTPVDTFCGRLCVSVAYHSSLSDVNSGPSTPMSPRFIPDYVGSPLADPLKRFSCVPMTHASPSSLPFIRPHSWSYDLNKASTPSVSNSLSPAYSETLASTSNPSSRRFAPITMPSHPPDAPSVHKKNMSFDEYSPSPNFTPSPSPSPPICIPGSHFSKALLRSESEPVRIPTTKLARSPVLSNKQYLPPSPPIRGTGSVPKSEKGTGLVQTGAEIEKLVSHVSISRSSSRSFQDDYDDSEFPCPFDVEDDDTTDLGSRPESFNPKGRLHDPIEPGGLFPIKKSQDAAVGALVHMLKKAKPLRQDISSSMDFSQDSRPKMWSQGFQEMNQISGSPPIQQVGALNVTSSGLVSSKTVADALEELQGYKEMVKGLLLAQAGSSNVPGNRTSIPKPTTNCAKGS